MDLNDLDTVFSSHKRPDYSNQQVQQITSNRNQLGGKLFFDRLLEHQRIGEAIKLYPPRSRDDLRRLHQKIGSTTFPNHEKQSLLFYILQDIHEPKAVTDHVLSHSHLPEPYAIFMKGLWHMDRMQFRTALEYLAQPCLTPLFAEEIISTLIRHSPQNDVTLPLAYYHSVSPIIESWSVLQALLAVQCQASITEAFYFTRQHAENQHKILFERLISAALSTGPGPQRAARSVELINLPFTASEESWFEEYLSKGKGQTLSGAKETVTMRKLAMARYEDALASWKGPGGRKIDGLSWETLKYGLTDGIRSRPAKRPSRV